MTTTFSPILARVTFNTANRLECYRMISNGLANGAALSAIIDNMTDVVTRYGARPNHPFALIFGEWRDGMKRGLPFHEAVGNWIPETERLIISGAEHGETLVIAMRGLVKQVEAERAIKGSIQRAMFQPIAFLAMGMGLLYVVSSQFVPELIRSVPAEAAQDAAPVFLAITSAVENYPWIVLIPIIGIIVLFRFLMPREFPGRRRIDGIVPFNFYRLMQGSGFLMTMAGMTRVGVQQATAVQQIAEIGSPWLRARCLAIYSELSSGKPLGKAMMDTGFQFPTDRIIDTILFYEELPNVKEVLQVVAEEWIENGKHEADLAGQSILIANMLAFGAFIVWVGYNISILFQLMPGFGPN